jgi:cellulose synthase/poly-beta-1,6-N-acetylglucosamine synthase-like glycosyltransferase
MENANDNASSSIDDGDGLLDDNQTFVSVVLPILNEAEFIEDCLYAIYLQDYPGHLMEIIVADGLSTDGTRDIIQRHVDGYRPTGPNGAPLAADVNVRMVDNPKRIVSAAMNIAIEASVGDVIVRIDGHTIIATDYVTQCIAALKRSKADGVGGPMRAIGKGFLAKAIALATSSRFGIGNSTYRTSKYFKELAVETTHMGAYRKSILLDVGLFNEYFVRHQDYELDYRIRQRGGSILLSPEIKSIYYVRGRLRKLWRQYFQYGFWKGRFLRTNFNSMKLRHMVPPTLVLALTIGAILAAIPLPYGSFLLLAVVVVYLSFLIAASFALCRANNRQYWWIVPIVLACLHLSWGMGVWFGLLLPDFMSPKRWRR